MKFNVKMKPSDLVVFQKASGINTPEQIANSNEVSQLEDVEIVIKRKRQDLDNLRPVHFKPLQEFIPSPMTIQQGKSKAKMLYLKKKEYSYQIN